MRSFRDHNPAAISTCYLAAAGVAMFSMDPVILLTSLMGALTCFFILCGMQSVRSHICTLLLMVVMTLINPLISHNGATVLFVMNHNPVTLEALLYGAAAAVMIVSVLYWFRSFSHIMTSDKLLYLFGRLSPRLGLVLSMAMRYVPLFAQQAAQINSSQKALGLYREDNVIDRFRGGLRIFSIMVTWTLENGIITADSMTARGYGVGRRSQFSIFRWTRGDLLLLIASLALGALTLWGISARSFAFYPHLHYSPLTIRAAAGYAAYALLAMIPTIFEAKEAIRWHCLKSNI